LTYKSIKGTKDILPSESWKWQWVEQKIRDVMRNFSFREIRTPLFEQTSLFSRSIGELTDIVSKEMYTFQDRSGESLTLRPEMTASVVRAYIQHDLGEQLPLVKQYYIGPMFRQERPQAGRLRQFHQFGAEAIGSQQPSLDVEMIALALDIYEALGVKKTILKINSVGCEKCRPPYKKMLKERLEKVREQLSPESQRRLEANPLRVLDSKAEEDKRAIADIPLLREHLCAECSSHFISVLDGLSELRIPYEEDGHLVRGLDYYTKTAFEVSSKDLGAQDALAGGGRYDLLTQELGGKVTPGIGFAAGIERLMSVLEKQKLFPDDAEKTTVFIAALGPEAQRWSLRQALELRRSGISVELDFLNRSLKSQMREADRLQVKHVVIVGENEVKSRTATIKNMKTGEQKSINFDSVTTFFNQDDHQ
jgi:histidyl-tRNA synthetase